MSDKSRERIAGKVEAIGIITKALQRSKALLNDPSKSISSLIFLGPTGPGKTEPCKILCKFVFDPKDTLVRIRMFEVVPLHLDAERHWSIMQRHKIIIAFHTEPTAMRSLMIFSNEIPNEHNLSSLRVLRFISEPVNPEEWRYHYEVIDNDQCAIVDTC